MVAVAVALGSSLVWGLADYLGGVKSRRLPVAVVLSGMYLTSLAVVAAFVTARGAGPPGTQAVAAGLGAGLFGIAGLSAFYRALAIGTMSIVAPIASTGVVLPVLVGLAAGDQPGPLRAIGLAVAVVGVVLASREDGAAIADPRRQRQSVALAIVAGLGFGTYLVLAQIASDGDVGWALLLSRLAATPFVVAFALFALRRGGRRVPRRELAAVAGIGLLDLVANVLYNVATTIGELSSVAVASSLYPVTTVLLAASLLGERIGGVQRAGVVLALCGVVLVGAGT
jgi:drug/metabolite transporter (DMT)-like permease